MAITGETNSQFATRRIAKHALLGGVSIMLVKFAIFKVTNSVAVLADGVDSIVNLIAAIVMLYGIWLVGGKKNNEFGGGGKAEYLAVGFEGWLILIIGLVVGYISIERLTQSDEISSEVVNIELGLWLLGAVATFTTCLAAYVWIGGKRHDCIALKADALHMLADVASTIGVMLGLTLIKSTGMMWLDPVVALLVTAIVLWTSWRLMWKSVLGLTDELEREIDPTITNILTEETEAEHIKAFDNVRYRLNGPHRWVEFRLLVDPAMTIAKSEALTLHIEQRIKEVLDNATVTAHIEAFDERAAEKIDNATTKPDAPTEKNDEENSDDGNDNDGDANNRDAVNLDDDNAGNNDDDDSASSDTPAPDTTSSDSPPA